LGSDEHEIGECAEHTTTLPPGSTLLLHTDGLRERLAELTGTPLTEAVDEVVRDQVPKDPDDDVVVLAIRVIRSAASGHSEPPSSSATES
jgi:hypothetical protein